MKFTVMSLLKFPIVKILNQFQEVDVLYYVTNYWIVVITVRKIAIDMTTIFLNAIICVIGNSLINTQDHLFSLQLTGNYYVRLNGQGKLKIYHFKNFKNLNK